MACASLFYHFFGALEGGVDVGADVLFAQFVAEACVVEHFVHFFLHAGEHYLCAFAATHGAERLQVVDAGGVDEGHAAHADDAHLGMVGHARHEVFKLVGDAEEVGAVDFVYLYALGDDEVFLFVELYVDFFGGVNLVGNEFHLGGLGHAAHEEQTGDDEAHLDGNGEVEDDGEQEGDEQHGDVALGVLHQGAEGAPAAHVVRHDDEHAGQASHGDVGGKGHEHEEDEQEHDGMDDARNGSTAAVVDVGHGAGDGSRGGDTAEEGCADVGDALADELLVRVVAVARYAVGHGGREEALDGAEHSDGHGRGEEELHLLPCDVGHGEGRNLRLDVGVEVANGLDAADAGKLFEQIYGERHHHDGNERAGYLFRHLRGEGDDGNAEEAYEHRGPVDGVEMGEVDTPFGDEVGRHAADLKAEEVLDLRGEDGDGDTAGETHHDGIGDELDDGAEAEHAKQDKKDTRQHGGYHQAGEAKLLDDAVDDDDESAGGAANLYARAAEGGDDEARHDGGDDALLGRYAGGDTKRDGEGKGYDAHDETGHEVGHEFLFAVATQVLQEARRKSYSFHTSVTLLKNLYLSLSRQRYNFFLEQSALRLSFKGWQGGGLGVLPVRALYYIIVCREKVVIFYPKGCGA